MLYSTARISEGPSARKSRASSGATDSAFFRPAGPSSDCTTTSTVPSPPTRLISSCTSRTDGTSEGSSSWKLERISRCEAAHTDTPASASETSRKDPGRATAASVTRAVRPRLGTGAFTQRVYYAARSGATFVPLPARKSRS